MPEDLYVLGEPPSRGELPHRPPLTYGPVVILLGLLAIAAGSIVLGAKRDPLLTLVVWGVVGIVWAGRALAHGRVNALGAAAMVASVGLVGAGLSLAAYGMSHCTAGGFSMTVDNRRFGDFCSARETDFFYLSAGFVIALAGMASVRSVRRQARFIGFLKAFVPIAVLVLLLDLGGAGAYAAPVTVPALVILARKSGSRLYKIGCYLLGALTLWEVGWLVSYTLSN
jgi:hypothetical protein